MIRQLLTQTGSNPDFAEKYTVIYIKAIILIQIIALHRVTEF